MDPLTIVMTVLAVLLIIGILLQQRGAGIGGALGGGDAGFSTRRGSEKTIFNATIIIAVLFFAAAIARLFF